MPSAGTGPTTCASHGLPEPKILNPRDAIIKVTLTAICGSDLHLLDGFIPTMRRGDILGHEFMGEVVEVGRDNHRLKVGDRVVVPFTIACGRCFFCDAAAVVRLRQLEPQRLDGREALRGSASGLFGYSHMMGGYAGGQAEYVRVPFADVGPLKVPAAAVGRTGAVPLGHLPDRIHGGGELQHPAGRYGRGVGMRPGRPVRDQERVDARCGPGDRDRSSSRNGCAWPAIRARPKRSTTNARTCSRR